MKTPAILALAGAVAISVGLTAAVDAQRINPSPTPAQTSSQNGATTPRVTPDDSPTVSPAVSSPTVSSPASILPTQPDSTSAPVEPALPTHIGSMVKTSDGHPVLYITFDDGPSLTHTAKILAVLARHHARATFFVEGRFAHRYPQLITAELAAGNTVGSHTWTHPHLPRLSSTAIQTQLLATQHFLWAMGAPALCFRPPFGETNATVHKVEADLGIHEYMWTTETKDWTHASTAHDLQRADAGLHPGAIIVFHDGRGSGSAQTVAAVDEFLTRAEAKGYIALPLPC